MKSSKQVVATELCIDGKRHNFKPIIINQGYGYDRKNYYEHFKVEKKIEEYSVNENGKYITKTREVDVHVDDTPGFHYQMVYCSGCGTQKEIIAKQRGPNYKELKYNSGRG